MPSARICVMRTRWKRFYFELYSKMEADINKMKTPNSKSPYKTENGMYLNCIYLLFYHDFLNFSTSSKLVVNLMTVNKEI